MKPASKSPANHFNPAALKAIIFDMDDTLYPERSYVLSGFRAVAAWAEAQWQIPAVEGYERFVDIFNAGIRGDVFNRWLAAYQIVSLEEVVLQMVKVYRDHDPEISLFPQVRQSLTLFRQRYRLGLISDGYLHVQQRKLAALQVASWFDTIVFSDEWGREAWKPAAHPYEEALRQLDIAAEEAVYVADNPKKDFLGARQVGMWAVWLCQPEGEYTHLQPSSRQHEPHITLQSWGELGQLFCSKRI
ncbi:MAG: HAD family hydrolase [Anaerolineales bacterium]|nr:HAD family hydrolase [Anaerolineales bacterium]